MTKLAAFFLILPLIGAVLSNGASSGDSGGIDWSGANVSHNQRLIENDPDLWRRGNLSMGLYGVSVALGVVIFALAIGWESENGRVVAAAIASALLVVFGAASWMYVCINRFTLPPAIVAQNLGIAPWTTPAMDIPFVAGTVLLGAVIWQRYSIWGGGFIIAADLVLISLAYYSFGDIPPWTHFLVFLIAGFVLLIVESGHQTGSLIRAASDLRLKP